MKKTLLGPTLGLLVGLTTQQAFSNFMQGVGFTAPTIKDPSTNVGSDAVKGDIVLDTNTTGGGFKGYNGSSWVSLDSAGSSDTVKTPSATSPVVISAVVADGTLSSQIGGGFSSCTKISTGNYNCSFTTSFFSSTPNCVANGVTNVSTLCNAQQNGASDVDVDCFEPYDGTAINRTFTIICHGVQ